MRNIKLTLEYDGTNYNGWQAQKHNPDTIQEKIENALTIINKKPVKIYGASRTDAGVHALGQTASVMLDVLIPVENIPLALNSLLPDDIVCKKAELMDMDFHARYDAKGKKYRYRIYNDLIPSVFSSRYVYYYKRKLNLSLMGEAALHLTGTKDFSAFRAAGCTAVNTVKTINSIEIIEKKPEVWIEITGSGFLYNMVRIIVGTLIEVSTGKIKIEDLDNIIRSGDRRLAGYTVPARGLTLVEVYYN
ncbi:MAG: tRNA pseudouridine(38-40) synthase TruA [Halanaerobiaceae bacterium]|nr:tRNA pseudouridine(38-40) synthase TruA [Halanaerobiaceae bacterium]